MATDRQQLSTWASSGEAETIKDFARQEKRTVSQVLLLATLAYIEQRKPLVSAPSE